MTRRLPTARQWAATIVLVGLVSACGPSPSSSLAEEAAPAGPILGCLSIEQAECEFVAQQVAAVLPAARGAPFAIIVHLSGCPFEGPCPRTLGVRQGRVTAEYVDGGEPVELSVIGPPEAPRFGEAEMAWSGLQQPSSQRVAGVGPFPFTLGHCGLTWQVDFDGSFWLPIGQVDGDATETVNAISGRMSLLGPNLAQYTSENGFTATLARFPGQKHVSLCM